MLKWAIAVLSLAMLAVYVAGVPATLIGAKATPRADYTLAKYLMARQMQLRAGDPAASAQCFSIYLPLLTQVADQWSDDYTVCVDDASGNRTAVLEQKRAQQEGLSKDASGVCSYINTCQAINETLEFFDCFALLSQNVLGDVYTISNNASDLAGDLVEELNLIDVDLYKCTNASERAYVEQTASIYEALDYCLQYGPPPTLAPPPSTTPAPTTTSQAPISSTTAEVTVAPLFGEEAVAERLAPRSFAAALQEWLQTHQNLPGPQPNNIQ